jgi:hypothetical protein
MQFLEWNNRLAAFFFNQEMDGREVLLNVNKRIIQEEIGQNNFGIDSFIEAVKSGPSWSTREGLCMKAYQAFENWRSRNLEFPPYIAFLVLFVLANDVEGDFDQKAYYPRLRTLLGEDPTTGPPPSFYKMFDLWCDLEKWSKEDKKEELGSFTPRFRGGYFHVGLPLSQTLLTREEIIKLPLLFDEANFEPGMSASQEIVINALRENGIKYLSARTMKLLSKPDTEFGELRNSLVQFVQDELSIWDGNLPEHNSESEFAAKMRTGLRICLEIKRGLGGAEDINAYLRLKFNTVIPKTGFYLKPIYATENLLHCLESTQRWTTPVSCFQSKKKVDAFTLNWLDGFAVIENEGEWKAKLNGDRVRLFTKGKEEGLPQNHWVESTQVLQRNSEFLVACPADFRETIEKWVYEECENVNGNTQRVLPNGWFLYHAKNARQSCVGVSILTFSPDLNLRFRGGFKLGKGNRYFNFGLPEVTLENSDNESVYLVGEQYHHQLVQPAGSTNVWLMPEGIPTEQTFKFEVTKNGNPVQLRRNYAITVISGSELLANNKIDSLKRASSGDFSDSLADEFISGARLKSNKEIETRNYNFLPLYLASKIIFIGQKPGEICEFPGESIPREWNPVWLLAKQHRDDLLVHFCGADLNLPPLAKKKIANPNLQKKWKEAIWIKRKHQDHSLLKLKPLQKLWSNYQDVAKNI